MERIEDLNDDFAVELGAASVETQGVDGRIEEPSLDQFPTGLTS